MLSTKTEKITSKNPHPSRETAKRVESPDIVARLAKPEANRRTSLCDVVCTSRNLPESSTCAFLLIRSPLPEIHPFQQVKMCRMRNRVHIPLLESLWHGGRLHWLEPVVRATFVMRFLKRRQRRRRGGKGRHERL